MLSVKFMKKGAKTNPKRTQKPAFWTPDFIESGRFLASSSHFSVKTASFKPKTNRKCAGIEAAFRLESETAGNAGEEKKPPRSY